MNSHSILLFYSALGSIFVFVGSYADLDAVFNG